MCSFHNFMCLLEPKHKHTVTCHGSNSNQQWGNSNGKNDSVEKEAKAKKNKTKHTAPATSNESVCCNLVWQAKKNQSRCCLALCKIPNSTGLSTVDAKCQLYHKTKAVGKVHKQFCHSPFTLKCTSIQIVCMRIYTSLGMNSQISKQRYGSILKFHNIPMLIIS